MPGNYRGRAVVCIRGSTGRCRSVRRRCLSSGALPLPHRRRIIRVGYCGLCRMIGVGLPQLTMTIETRRRLATLLIGTAATLTALLTATWLRQDACLDASGRWIDATRQCEL